ncbi:MAG: SpoIIE family protein phosphatase [Clostridia bacterium]|nr:SpoIIE family protein phosphatase [Clostridia bacterium]
MREYKETDLMILPQSGTEKKTIWRTNVEPAEWLVRAAGFFLARAMPVGGLAPFGLAFLAMERQPSVRSLISLAWVMLGYISLARADAMGYIVGCGIYYLSLWFFREQKGTSLKGAVISSVLAIVLADLAQILVSGAELLFFARIPVDGGLVALGVLVFDRCRGYLEGRKFLAGKPSKEEKFALCVMAGVVLLSFQNLPMPFAFSVANMLGILAVGMVAVANGPLSGAVAGVVTGVVLGLKGDCLIFLSVFGCCGIAAGMVSKYGRWPVVLVLTGVGTVLSGMAIGDGSLAVRFYELTLGAVILAFLPEKMIRIVGKFTEFGVAEGEASRICKVHIKEKLDLAAGSFETLANRFTEISDKRDQLDMEEVSMLFDTASERVCRHCSKVQECWKIRFTDTYKSMLRFLDILERKGALEPEDAGHVFYGKCLRIEMLVKEINRLYEIYKINQVWKNKLCENRELVSQQFRGVGEILKRIGAQVEETAVFDFLAADEIAARLRSRGIALTRVQVFTMPQGRRTVELISPFPLSESVRLVIPSVLKGVLGGSFLAAEGCDNRYYEMPRLQVAAGFATTCKQEENGDSHALHRLRSGKFLAVLSDGMGCGYQANRESSTIVTLLEDFMEAGFDKGVAVKLINSVMVMKSANEAFATVDMCMIDLDSGEAEFIKNGAEASYIKHLDRVETVRSSSLPVGVVSGVEIASFAHQLERGDVVVMASDGLEMKQGHEGWIRHTVEHMSGDLPVQEIADRVMEKALCLKDGTVDDDMTVLVLKVM